MDNGRRAKSVLEEQQRVGRWTANIDEARAVVGDFERVVDIL
jgi:hypothetical protein